MNSVSNPASASSVVQNLNTDPAQEQQPVDPIVALTEQLTQKGISPEQAASLAQVSDAALSEVSTNKAVFELREWERILSKQGHEGWLSDPNWGSMRSLIARHIGMIPLVADQAHEKWALYAPKHLMEKEREMIDLAKRENDDHPIPKELLDKAFAAKPTIADEQRLAAIACCSGRRTVMVTEGTAGAGKSFTLDVIREVYESVPPRPGHPEDGIGYDIYGTALSWTAAKVLEGSANLKPGSCVAIQGLVMKMDQAKEKKESFFKRRSVLVVDEAGLVGVEHMHKLLKHAAESPHPVRVILTGDSLQLNPVMAGNALEAIVDECGSARLDTIRRQKQDSHRKAVKHFCFGRAHHGLWTFWQQEAIHFCANAEYRRELVMRDYVRTLLAFPTDTALVLALDNNEVRLLNEQIRDRLKQVGRLTGTEYEMTVVPGPGNSPFKARFCVGDQVVLRKNSAKHPVLKSQFQKLYEGVAKAHETGLHQASNQSDGSFFNSLLKKWKKERSDESKNQEPDEVIRAGIFNRMNAIILNIKKHPDQRGEYIIRLLLAEGGETEIDTSVYKDEESKALPLTHNFATTIYASQGQTVQRVYLMDSALINRKLAYVGMSRHTLLCDIYLDLHELHERMALEQERKKKGSILFAKDLIFKKRITEPEKLAQLYDQVEKWAKDQYFKPSDYVRAAALVWNKDSLNPTAWMKLKHMKEKKQQVIKEGDNAFAPRQWHEDDPDDFNQLNEKNPDFRYTEPPAFETLQQLNALENPRNNPKNTKPSFTLFSWKKDASTRPSAAPLSEEEKKKLQRAGLERTELPSWAQTPPMQQLFKDLKYKYWGLNRFGYARLFAKDPVTGYTTSRWRLDGQLMAGDGEPPVLLNDQHPQKAGWLVVPGAREALLSYHFFRNKHHMHPERVPHIVVGFPTADFKSLAKYLKPGSAPLYCAWSEQDPASLDKAKLLAKRLHALGHRVALYPKDPSVTPQQSPPKP